jgi:hypothetical protein
MTFPGAPLNRAHHVDAHEREAAPRQRTPTM